MNLEIAVILIISFIMIYLILIHTFSVLFRITGLTKQKAKFQAISLLTCCGFTTTESEIITNDKARRKIATVAMLIGYAFSVIIVSLVLNLLFNLDLSRAQTASTMKVILIAGGVFVGFIILFQLPFVKKAFEGMIAKIALRIMRRNNYENTITILDAYGKEAICEIFINNMPDILEDTPLYEAHLRDNYKINILMLKRKNKIIEITKDTILQHRDVIVVFGLYQGVKDLFSIKVSSQALVDDEEVLKQNVIDLMDNYGTDAMAEVLIHTVPEILLDKPLFESGLKTDYNINVLIVKRGDTPINVTKDTIIQEMDSLVVFGPYQKIKDVFM